VILLEVEQVGGIACHTGRPHCFFRRLEGDEWVTTEAVLKDPAEIYGAGAKAHGGKAEAPDRKEA